jgi:hypothetical protein
MGNQSMAFEPLRSWQPVAAVTAMLAFVTACGGASHAPSAPSPVPVVSAPQTKASLVIEKPSLLVYPRQQGDPFGYEGRFRLTETSGNSGATIQNVFLGNRNGGGDNTGPICWRDTLRVPPGGTLDTFYTDDGSKWLGYCGVWSGGSTQTPTLQLAVTFTDDDGRTSTVEAVVSVTK